MNQYTTVNILDLLEAVGEDETRDILSDFTVLSKSPKSVLGIWRTLFRFRASSV